MRVFFSVGEPSGDLHAANLIRRLRRQNPNIEAVGFGGPKMQAAGCALEYDLTQLAVMFLWGAIKNLRIFFRLIAAADQYFSKHQVDAVVLIDYPGLNWWIARKAKKHQIPVFYYGVPQMWAWAPWRIGKIRKFVDHVICKLPFEPRWFQERGCDAYYVGHPYFDQLHLQTYDDVVLRELKVDPRPLVLLLPGSRDNELARNLTTLGKAAQHITSGNPRVRLMMGCFNEHHQQMAQREFEEMGVACEIVAEQTPELMKSADACIACSGSVSLELLYHRLPTVIVYKIGWLKLLLQAFVLRCKFITLPNLMMTNDIRKRGWWPYDPDAADAEAVLMPEYLTAKDCSKNIARRILEWLDDDSLRSQNCRQLDELAAQYAQPGATHRAADYILEHIQSQNLQDRAAA